jgi:NTE family protein
MVHELEKGVQVVPTIRGQSCRGLSGETGFEQTALPTGAPCALPEPPQSAGGVALHSLTLLIAQRLINEIAGLQGAAEIKVLPPLCPLAVSASDFRHAAELIARARQTSLEWISSGDIDLPAPERFLSLHHHRPEGMQDEPSSAQGRRPRRGTAPARG